MNRQVADTRHLCAGLLVLALLWSLALPAAEPLPQVQFTFDSGQVLEVEVAATRPAQMRGLMLREYLAEQAGMLFVLSAEQSRHCFWMRDTFIPLSLGFLDAQFTLLEILELQPLDETPRCSHQPAAYALEVNRGWFERQGMQPGMRFEPSVPLL